MSELVRELVQARLAADRQRAYVNSQALWLRIKTENENRTQALPKVPDMVGA